MDALIQRAAGVFGKAHQLDAEAQSRRLIEVGKFDGANAMGGDSTEIDARAERQRRQQAELVGRVDAIDVKAGVSLGIAGGLGLGEDGGEGQTLRLHSCQDIVAGAVEQAINAGDAVCRHAFAERLDDRDATRDRCFIAQRQPFGFGGGGEIKAVMGEHRLVGGNQRLAGVEGAARQR